MLEKFIIVAAAGTALAFLRFWLRERGRRVRTFDELTALRIAHRTLEERHAALRDEHQSHDAEEHRLFGFLHELGETLYADTTARKLYRRIARGTD